MGLGGSATDLMRATFHLVPRRVWAAGPPGEPYVAESLATEGFIHCTDGVEALGATFDRYYARDPTGFVALTIDLDAVDVPWRYDLPGSLYPHVYGPIARPAIVAINRVRRRRDGRFAGLTAG